MPSPTTYMVVQGVALVVVPALIVGLFAYLSSKRQSIWFLVGPIVLIWIGIATLIGYSASNSSLFPDRIPFWRDVLTGFADVAPLAILPTVFTVPALRSGTKLWKLLVLATVGAVIALPITFYTALASTCYIAHDCP